MRVKWLTMAVFAAVLSLSGCSGEVVEPQQSFSSAQERLYQDAFEVYSQFFELDYALEQLGGAETLPDEIKQYVMGPELESITQALYNGWQLGLHYTGENSDVIDSWQRISDPEQGSGAFLRIAVCRHHESTDLLDAEGAVRIAANTRIVLAEVSFARDSDGSIKVYDVATEKVESCPF